MSEFLSDFSQNDYCFRTRNPGLEATAVDEVITSGIRAYISSSITFSPSNPWFDRVCASAIADREGVHWSLQDPPELTHARNRGSAKVCRVRSSFHERKNDRLNSSPTEKCFWSLSKKKINFCKSNFLTLIRQGSQRRWSIWVWRVSNPISISAYSVRDLNNWSLVFLPDFMQGAYGVIKPPASKATLKRNG